MLRRMTNTRFRLIFAGALFGAVVMYSRISLAQAPTETDQRISTLSDRIEKRATKEELAYVQKGLDTLTARVDKMGDKTSDIATEMRVAEVIGVGLAFVVGIFIQKIVGRLMPEKQRR
jgi:hypothetical protein